MMMMMRSLPGTGNVGRPRAILPDPSGAAVCADCVILFFFLSFFFSFVGVSSVPNAVSMVQSVSTFLVMKRIQCCF